MSRTKPKGDIIGWEIKVNYGYFTVELIYQNQVRRAYTYQFHNYDEVFDGLDKLAKRNVPRQIFQEIFDELVHEEILSTLLAEERYKKTGKVNSPYDGKRFSLVQRVEKESPVEG
jgi:hypothetical protein